MKAVCPIIKVGHAAAFVVSAVLLFFVSIISIFCYNVLQIIICIYERGMRSHDFIYLYIINKIVIS